MSHRPVFQLDFDVSHARQLHERMLVIERQSFKFARIYVDPDVCAAMRRVAEGFDDDAVIERLIGEIDACALP